MLRVFLKINGSPTPVEVTVAASGQNLVAAGPGGAGRKAHFWWTLAELEAQDAQAAGTLAVLAPNLDMVWVGRDLGGSQLQEVFSGTVVECGHDQQMVSLTAMEPPRQAAPPQTPGGGVREPLRPAPSGPGPSFVPVPGPGAPPPPVPAPGQDARLDVFTSPDRQTGGETTATTGGALSQGMYVVGRERAGATG